MKKIVISGIITISILIAVGLYIFFTHGKVSTDNARVKIGTIAISSEVSGYVSEVLVRENQAVEMDDLMVKIEDTQYGISYQKAKSGLQDAESHLKFLGLEHERKSKMFAGGFISRSDFEKSEADLTSAKSQRDLAKTNTDLAEYYFEKTKIISPSNGVVSSFDIKVGDFISVGQPLFRVIDKSDIWIEANFKEIDLKKVRVGQKAVVKIDTFGHKSWNATVDSISSATGSEFSLLPAQNSSGNWIKVIQRITIRLKFDENQDLVSLASGMSAEVTINTKS
jgi:membrane fusion protein (multidrug efflux system)